MDALEAKVTAARKRSDDPTIFVDRARQAWRAVTGLEPAYVELLALQPAHAHCPRVYVEIDGVRLTAFRSHSEVKRNGFQQWDIAETKLGLGYSFSGKGDFSLAALEPYLKRRRKRLRKRNLYVGDDDV